MRSGWVLVACVLGVACGGRAVDDVGFHPGVGTAGYGYVGGYQVQLVDTTGGVSRTLRIRLEGTGDGSYAVQAQSAEAQLLEGSRSYHAVTGTVTLAASQAAPGPRSWGSVQGHVDLVLVDDADGAREIHLSGDYVADVAYVG